MSEQHDTLVEAVWQALARHGYLLDDGARASVSAALRSPAATSLPDGVDTRPTNCRFRLREEGKPHPRSGCRGCKGNVVAGLKTCPFEEPSLTPAPAHPSQSKLDGMEEAAKVFNALDPESVGILTFPYDDTGEASGDRLLAECIVNGYQGSGEPTWNNSGCHIGEEQVEWAIKLGRALAQQEQS